MNSFIIDLVLSFIIGGTWVTLASVAAQRFGGRIGGFIAGLPATSVLAIFFITYTQGADHGYDVTSIFPLAISANAIFLAAFAFFSKKSVSTGLFYSLTLWVFVQSALIYFHTIRFAVALTLGIFVFLASLLIISRINIPTPEIIPVHHGSEIAVRACSGGIIIVLAMLGSHVAGPVLGSILSAFPATIVATLILTNAYGGKNLSRIMARPMMVSGVINCMIFALVYRHVVLDMHIFAALAISYAATILSAIFTFYWMNIYHRKHVSSLNT